MDNEMRDRAEAAAKAFLCRPDITTYSSKELNMLQPLVEMMIAFAEKEAVTARKEKISDS